MSDEESPPLPQTGWEKWLEAKQRYEYEQSVKKEEKAFKKANPSPSPGKKWDPSRWLETKAKVLSVSPGGLEGGLGSKLGLMAGGAKVFKFGGPGGGEGEEPKRSHGWDLWLEAKQRLEAERAEKAEAKRAEGGG